MIFGPWEKFAEGYGKMVLGYFGKTPVEPDAEIVKLASEKMDLNLQRLTVDLNDADPNKGVDAAKKMLQENGLEESDENVFIAAACKQKGIDFLLGNVEINGVRKHSLMPKAAEAGGDGVYAVSLNGTSYNVDIKGDQATVNGKAYAFTVGEGEVSDQPVARLARVRMYAPMNAKVIKVNVSTGDQVQEGDVLFIVEAMKMEVGKRLVQDLLCHSIPRVARRFRPGIKWPLSGNIFSERKQTMKRRGIIYIVLLLGLVMSATAHAPVSAVPAEGISIAAGFQKLWKETGIYRFLNPLSADEKEQMYYSALEKTVDAQLAAGNFSGVVHVLDEVAAHGIGEETLTPYRERLAEARLDGHT